MIQTLTHICKYCKEEHLLEYQVQKNNSKHLVYKCPKRKGNHKYKAAGYLPYVPNLPIKESPAYKSNKQYYKNNTNTDTNNYKDELVVFPWDEAAQN